MRGIEVIEQIDRIFAFSVYVVVVCRGGEEEAVPNHLEIVGTGYTEEVLVTGITVRRIQ